jgi:hypothetical protein
LWTIVEDLRRHEAKFFNYFRMSVGSWITAWDNWVFCIKKTDTNIRKSIPPRDRSAVTFRQSQYFN